MNDLFYHLMSHCMDNIIDVEGRPLGEQRSSTLYSQIETVKIRCNYPGSRFNNSRPMNVSALKQIREHKEAILYIFSMLNNHILKQEGVKKISYLEIWEIVSQAVLLPLFIHLKYKQKIPSYAAGLYKVSFGLISVAMKLTLLEISGKKLAVTPDYIFQTAETSGELIGSSEVCAAPERLIKEVAHSIIYGDSITKPSELDSLDIDSFLKFSTHSVHFSFCFLNYLIYTRNLYNPFSSLYNSQTKEDYRVFQESMKKDQDNKTIPPVSQIEDLISYNEIKKFHEHLNIKYFPKNLNKLNYFPLNSSIRSKLLEKTKLLDPETSNAVINYSEYETSQLKAFNYLLSVALENINDLAPQPLTIDVIEKTIGISPFDFLYAKFR